MAIQTHADACMGLDDAECCAQSLDLAGYRATQDQLPKATKTPVRMSCSDETKVVPESACRSIAISRGISVKEVGALCAAPTLEKRCKQNAACKQCTEELEKLAFKASHRACYAVTYVPPAQTGTKVITLQDAQGEKGAKSGDEGVVIRKRRTVVE